MSAPCAKMYMVPFEAAVREAHVQAVMTSYNRINGPLVQIVTN